jgi:hypothetical protein
MKCIAALILAAFVLFIPTSAQEADGPKPDRWNGLIIDQSTSEDTEKILGKPIKEKVAQLQVNPLESWISKKRKEKVFTTLEYKNPKPGVEKLWLAFLDGKLVSILMDMKEGTVAPNALSNIYGIEFQPIISQADLGLFPRDFERNQGKIYPKSYPTVYHLSAVSEKSFVTAMIGNVPSFGGALGKSMGIPDKPGSFPGKVAFIQILSRKLETLDGADALK